MATALDDTTKEAFASLLSSLSTAKNSADAASAAEASRKLLESKLDGPSGVVNALLPQIWLPSIPQGETLTNQATDMVQGDDALAIISYLVETHQSDYMAITARAVRHDAEINYSGNNNCGDRQITDALLTSMAKLIIAPDSESQVGISTDAHAALLALCKYNQQQNIDLPKRLFGILNYLWAYLQQQKQRECSTAQMRIAALMIDVCLLGNNEMSLALDGSDCIMNKLLTLALDQPNDDPLLQMSALDQLERLTFYDNKTPMSSKRAEFLLSHDTLRRGLLFLVGINDEESKTNDDEGEIDPINGGAAMRLLTEICRVGVSISTSGSLEISERTFTKFHTLLQMFQRALHNFQPHGELERLSYIHAASSLVASCSIVASSSDSSASSKGIATSMLQDTIVLNEWLSLHSRVSQPKLKSALLCSLAQVMQPSLWSENVDSSAGTQSAPTNITNSSNNNTCTRPSDAIVMQLLQAFSHANNDRDSTELVLLSAKSPFIEERLGAYSVLRALAMRGIGVRSLLLHEGGAGGGFLEWLLKHENETTSEGKQAKYQIVEAMLGCNKDFIRGLLSDKVYSELELWLNRGPSFVRTVPWEMATE